MPKNRTYLFQRALDLRTLSLASFRPLSSSVSQRLFDVLDGCIYATLSTDGLSSRLLTGISEHIFSLHKIRNSRLSYPSCLSLSPSSSSAIGRLFRYLRRSELCNSFHRVDSFDTSYTRFQKSPFGVKNTKLTTLRPSTPFSSTPSRHPSRSL